MSRRGLGLYILKGKIAIPCDNTIRWAMWFEKADRKVAEDFVTLADDTVVCISTIFIGLDHQFGDGDPLVFETMIFGGPLDQYQMRYPFWLDAEEGHKVMVERCKQLEKAS